MKHNLFKSFILALGALALIHSTAAQPPATLRHSIPGPDGTQSEARLGRSVAVDGGFTVVGAPLDDAVGGYDSGIVKVFDSATGALLHVIPNPSPDFYDSFGTSVAISGARVVVGASGDDTGAHDAGAAYVYDLASPTPTLPVVTLNNPSPAVQDNFGASVAISGTRVVVGAHGDDTGAGQAGIAYVYNLLSPTPAVPEVTLNNPAPSSFASFGYSVAIAGTRVVASAPGDDTGAIDAGSVYVYDLLGATPTVPAAALRNPAPAQYDTFGFSVAISGTRVVVGELNNDTGALDAGSAHVFDLAGVTPTIPVVTMNNPTPEIFDVFGSSVAISGLRVVVGAYGDDLGANNSGRAYVYDLASATPAVPSGILNNPTPAEFENFGTSVAISGARVVVGAPLDDTGARDAGSAYLYDVASATPTIPTATLNNPGPSIESNFGTSVAISGTRMVVGASLDDTGATNAGRAYVYNLASGTPLVPEAVLDNPAPRAFDQFGYSVAVSGTFVVVGGLTDGTGGNQFGRVYVYDLAGANPTAPAVILENPAPATFDNFGHVVAIAGTRVVVGASGDDTGATNTGSAYVYDLASGTPTVPAVILNNPTPAAQDAFGHAVAISGTRVVVAATGDDTGASDAGSVYVYDLASATPTVPVTALHNPVPAFAMFGNAVAISDTRVVIGAPFATPATSGSGVAYVYDLAGETPTTLVATLDNPGTAGGDLFGFSVAISGTDVLIGASYYSGGGTNPGSAYLYSLLSATPTTPIATLNNPTPAANDQFGLSVALGGGVAILGAPGDDAPRTDNGLAYVFNLPDSAGPANGSFTIAPASPVAPSTNLTATFAGWTDGSLPLSYEVREGAAVLVAAGSSATPTFTRPAGTHSITGRVYDSAGNFTEVGPVTIVVDGSAPTIATPGNLTASATSLAGAVVNFSVSATDDHDPSPTVTAIPPSGSTFPLGTTSVTVTARDAVDNESSATFTVTVTLDSPLASEVSTTGTAVPGAGSDPRIAAGAVWTALATPAINDAGQVAYLGKWKAPAIAGESPAQVGAGIFIDSTLLVKAGQPLPEAGTIGLPANATFKSFRDPVLDGSGNVSFLASIAGSGISSANDTVVISNAQTGALRVLAREGDEAPETGGATFKSFANVSALGSVAGGTLFTASLKPGGGDPRVTSASDTGVWWWPAGGNAVLNLTREGNPGFSGGETIKSVLALSAVSGSPGHGRGLISGDRALIRLTLTGPVPRQALVLAIPGVLTEVAGTGTAIGGTMLPAATWKTMNLPASDNTGQNIAVLGSLTPNTGGTVTGDVKGIYVTANGGADWDPLARLTDVAHGFATIGAAYAALSDPVVSITDASVAYMGTVKGGTVRGSDNAVIWWRPQGSEVMILAREGAQPPGAPAGAKWNTFTSLAYPGGGAGPLFTATLKRGAANGKITAKDDFALYAVDTQGTIHEVIREGQPLAGLAGKTVKTFNALKAVAGTAGVTRAFNDQHQAAAHVTFTDGTTSIVKVEIP